MKSIRVGSVELTRIDESCEPAAFLSHLPALPADATDVHRQMLSPYFFDYEAKKLIFSIHTWLIQTPHHTVLFELGAGNGKHRPNFLRAHMRQTPWLERLAEAGVHPGDVDIVIASHLHTDHVGWFTTKVGNSWAPTFPNARYIIGKREFENWSPEHRRTPVPAFNEGVIEDSVTPVVDAGQVELVADDFRLDPDLTMLPAHGHTNGHVVLQVGSGREGAILAGDIAYSPLQVVYPDLNAYADEDMDAGPRTRRRIFDACSDNGWFLMPTHFGAPYSVVRLSKFGSGYAIHDTDGRVIGKSLD